MGIMRNFVKMYLLLWIGLLGHFGVYAQNLSGERRVYYLDATYSMVLNNLWEPSKENLIEAIKNIEDVNTEIVVVIFADDRNPQKKIWKKWEEKATTSGKNLLIKNIQELDDPVKSSMTNLYDPLVNFYSQTKPNKVNYMFLMTDGGHEQGGDFIQAIDSWKERTNNSLTYGFFVELTENVSQSEVKARDLARKHIDLQNERLWRVSSADVNINLIRLENSVTFNVRGDKYVDIPLYFSGKEKSRVEELTFSIDDSNFKVRDVEFLDNSIRLYINSFVNIHQYPANSEIPLTVELNSSDDKTFLLTNKINIKCLNKKENVMFFSDNQIDGEVEFYDSFAWSDANIQPYTATIDLDFSEDALNDSECFVELAVVDNNGKILSPSDVKFSFNGVPSEDNKVKLTPADKSLQLSISFPENTESGVYQGYLMPTVYKMDRIGNIELDSSSEYPFVWRVEYDVLMNPLLKALIWLGIIIVALLLLWFLVIKPMLFPRFGNFRKMVIVKKNGTVVANFTVNFKGAKKVVFASAKVKQGFFNRLFTGRIDTVVNPAFDNPILFLPKNKKSAIVKGQNYLVMPNPIPQSGVAEISTLDKKMSVKLQ